jgi:hypothetical protein
MTSVFRANAIKSNYDDICNNNNNKCTYQEEEEEEDQFQLHTPAPCNTTTTTGEDNNTDIGLASSRHQHNNSQRRRQPWNIENEYQKLLQQVKLVNSTRGDKSVRRRPPTMTEGGGRGGERKPSPPPGGVNTYNRANTASNIAALVVPKLNLQALCHEPSPRLPPPSSLAMQSGGSPSKTARTIRGGGGGAPSSSSARKGTGRQKYTLATSRFETSSGGKQARLVHSPAALATASGGGVPLVSPSSNLNYSKRTNINSSSSGFGAVLPVVVMAADPPPSQPSSNNRIGINKSNFEMNGRVLPRKETHLRLQTLLANRQQQKDKNMEVEVEKTQQIDQSIDDSGSEDTASSSASSSSASASQGELIPTFDETTPSPSPSPSEDRSSSGKVHGDATDNGPAPPSLPVQQQGPVFMVSDIITTPMITSASSSQLYSPTSNANEHHQSPPEDVLLISSSSAWLPPSTSPGFSTLQPPTPGLTLQEDSIGRMLLSRLPPPPPSSPSSASHQQWKCGDIMDCLSKGGRLVRKCWVKTRGGGGGGCMLSTPSSLSSDNLNGAVRVVTCRLINLSRHGSTISSRSQRVQLSYKSRRRGGGLLYPFFPPVTALVKKMILPRMPWKPGCYIVVDTDKGMIRLVPPSVSELAVWALSLSTMMNMAATGGGVEMRDMGLAETEWSESGVLFQC